MAAQERRSKAASRRKSPLKGAKTVAAAKVNSAPVNPAVAKPSIDVFIAEYTNHGEGAKAAIAAGYSPKTAAQQASRLLANPAIRARINMHKADVLARVANDTGISLERTLKEIGRLAFFDMRKLYTPDGRVKPLHELDEATVAALTGIDVQILYGGSGDERGEIGHVVKWKAAAKDKALDMLMKHYGGYKADDDGKAQPFAQALAEFIGQLHSAGGSKLPIRQPVQRA